ncbi:PREDICTED: probable carbohydrate esterase At4g34215 [Ipomoea nil]|uniref:probable carbohydrate esterase At4g34215 n=1 Tax=Ipomoea nil TaxID=35883 RepID=UPI000900A3F7|nr:PREDICTED: probable carbohydrate esterase At4g34215 [Ipomoea nil]
MEMMGKKKKWQMKNESAMALLTVLLLILYFWRTMIPAGEMMMEAEKKKEEVAKQIIVLAGQSNMAGRGGVVARMVDGERIRIWDGRVPAESHRNPAVFRFSEHFEWELAQEPLHQGIYCNKTCGVGIGMAFANRLLELEPDFGVIGLVPCAAGGTSLVNWTSDTYYPYKIFLSRTRTAIKKGGILRAVLWYQGESDSKFYDVGKSYRKNLETLFRKMRSDLLSPTLPFFQVIIPHPKPPFKGPFTEDVRKAQTEIDIPNVIKVDADGLPMGPDGIHLTTEGYVRLGTMLAETVSKNKSVLLPNNNTTVSSTNHTCGCP